MVIISLISQDVPSELAGTNLGSPLSVPPRSLGSDGHSSIISNSLSNKPRQSAGIGFFLTINHNIL